MTPCKSFNVWICFAVVLVGWVLTQEQSHWNPSEKSHSCNWTCMILTLQWPGSFCLTIDKDICKVPQNIGNWTIHGLWPLHGQYCCSCWPIFHSHLQELEPELSQFWPSLLTSRSYFNFWKDEWLKHGTCAACVENLGSPPRYFRTALKLRLLFDIESALLTVGVKPSCNVSYEHDKLDAALGPMFGDNYMLQCVKDEKEREAWIQLKIHLSKNVTLGCPKEEKRQTLEISKDTNTSLGHPCPKDSPIFYFPVNHQHPKNPCG